MPHLLMPGATTAATTQEKEVTEPSQQGLASIELLASAHCADSGSLDGPQLVRRKPEYGSDLLGPVSVDPSWPAKAGQSFDAARAR